MASRDSNTRDDRTIRPIYVVYGKDRRRATEAVERIVDMALGEEADRQVNLSSYDGSEVALGDVLDELRTLPFLSPRRLVVVKDADGFIRQHRQALERYVAEPSATGVLVLMAESFPGNTRLAKLVAKTGRAVGCEPIKRGQVAAYLTRYAAERYGLVLERDAAAELVELGGDDASVLAAEIDKIAAYLAEPGVENRRISPDIIGELVGNNRQFNVFNVIDAMTEGKADRALTLLGQMLAQDRQAQYTAVGSFAWQFRRLYNGRLLVEQGVSERDIVKQLRVWSGPDQFIRQVKRLTVRDIGAMLRELMRIDLHSKSGGTVRGGLERLIIGFCSAHGRVA